MTRGGKRQTSRGTAVGDVVFANGLKHMAGVRRVATRVARRRAGAADGQLADSVSHVLEVAAVSDGAGIPLRLALRLALTGMTIAIAHDHRLGSRVDGVATAASALGSHGTAVAAARALLGANRAVVVSRHFIG